MLEWLYRPFSALSSIRAKLVYLLRKTQVQSTLTPGSLSIIRASFDDEEQRGRAIGLWSGFSAITAALGPALGGSLVEHASWRWVFFINVPLAIVVLIILFLRVPENRVVGEEIHLDIVGALLATFG